MEFLPAEISPDIREIVLLNAKRVLIGLFLNWMLFGVLSVQIYLYCSYFPNDPWFTKIMVYIVLALDVAQTFLVTTDAFNAFVSHFGDISISNNVGLTWFAVPAMSGWIASMVQSVYAYRIFILSRSKTIYAVIMLLSVVQFGGSLMVAYEAKTAGVITGVLGSKESLITAGVWEGGSALCDIIIAVAMTHYLNTLSRENQIQKTRDLLTRIVRLSIGTGIITATLALVTLGVAYIPTHQSFWITCVMILGKVYTNSMMVALNSRLKAEPNSSYPLWRTERSRTDLTNGSKTVFVFAGNNFNTPAEWGTASEVSSARIIN